MEDLISVIVPVYNSEPYLRQCLDSLAAQTYPHIEFILVNDGSRDHSGAICESYAGRDSRFRYFAKENGGVSSARNLGLEQAGGAYIGFCDADDWVEPEMYETMYRHLCETSADIAMEGYCINDSQPAEEAACTSEILTAGNVIRDMIDGNIYGYVWNRLLRAELTKNVRFREGVALCEDELFGIECLMKATKVVYHKTPYYHYRINRTSATQHTNGNIQPLQKGFEAIQTLITEQLPEYAVHAECRTMRGNIVLARFCDSCHVLTKENWQKITAAIKALPHYKAARNLLPAPMRAEAMILLRTRRGYILGKKIYKALKKLRQYRIL